MYRFKCNTEKLFCAVYNSRRNFSCSRWLSLTHYDVLNVKTNSSQKEIRDAYIKLCKEYHPDRDEQDSTLHKKFLRINEAYNVLSKPKSRQEYDASIAYLRQSTKMRSGIVKEHYNTDAFRSAWNNPVFYHNRREEFMKEDPIPDDRYYGIKGIKRVSNGTMFLILVGFSIFSGVLQIMTIMSARTKERQRKSEEIGKMLQEAREKAKMQTEEEGLEEFEKLYHENLPKLFPNYEGKDTED